MENTWQYHGTSPIKIKRYLSQLGMGHRLFNDIKNGDGQFLVDHRHVRPTTQVLPNQTLTIQVDAETPDPTVKSSNQPLTIVYEDANWLVINKPTGIASIPGPTWEREEELLKDHPHLFSSQPESRGRDSS